MNPAIREILDQILRLSPEQRAELDGELLRIEEEEWTKLIADARRTARQSGIDDEAIARVVELMRYGDGEQKS